MYLAPLRRADSVRSDESIWSQSCSLPLNPMSTLAWLKKDTTMSPGFLHT